MKLIDTIFPGSSCIFGCSLSWVWVDRPIRRLPNISFSIFFPKGPVEYRHCVLGDERLAFPACSGYSELSPRGRHFHPVCVEAKDQKTCYQKVVVAALPNCPHFDIPLPNRISTAKMTSSASLSSRKCSKTEMFSFSKRKDSELSNFSSRKDSMKHVQVSRENSSKNPNGGDSQDGINVWRTFFNVSPKSSQKLNVMLIYFTCTISKGVAQRLRIRNCIRHVLDMVKY